ncbi:MAG: glycosyltransferase family 2 protein [Paracoccaceae bacterium]|nr:MAG: glycosyltransferase family 2 protein [Paracoccaceae bacterium]
MADWGVAALVDEPRDLLVAFAAHCLAQGAAGVHLFLDRARPDVMAALGGRPGIRLTTCDADWWAAHRREGRPALNTGRQQFVVNLALRDWPHDWMLHCDADEFPMAERPLADLLDAVPAGRQFAHAGVAERQFLRGAAQGTIFDGVLRLGRPGDGTRAAGLGAALAPCLNVHGLIGHGAGKCAVRRGAELRVGVHFPMPHGRGLDAAAQEDWRRTNGVSIAARLAHFDGLTPLHWVLKMLRRQLQAERQATPGAPPDFGKIGAARRNQVALVHGLRQDPVALAAAVDALLALGPDEAAALAAAGTVIGPAPDIATTARRVFPDLDLDFTPAAFDRHLRTLQAALIAETGLTL